MYQLLMPGTNTPYIDNVGGAFSMFDQMIAATGGLSLAQVCSITGIEPTTVQNWVKRGFIANPVRKKYYQRQLSRILIINALRECMQLEQIVTLLRYLNGDVEDSSDDNISESELYNHFCKIMSCIDIEKGISKERSDLIIKSTIQGFKGPHTDSYQRLYKTLSVAVCAYIAGSYKKEADLLFNQLEV